MESSRSERVVMFFFGENYCVDDCDYCVFIVLRACWQRVESVFLSVMDCVEFGPREHGCAVEGAHRPCGSGLARFHNL